MSAFLAACGGSDSTTSSDSSGGGESSTASETSSGGGEEFTIGYSSPVDANPAVHNFQLGFELQAESLGAKVIATDSNLEPNKQLSDIQSLINQGVDALVISPLDPKGLEPVMAQAKQKGIPVIGWSTGGAPGYVTNFETDDEQVGEEAAELITEEIGKGGTVAAVQGLPVIPVILARAEGFKKGAKAGGLDVVAEQINETDKAEGSTPIVESWKTKYGSSLEAIFAYNDPSALGAAATVNGDFDPIITGANASEEGVEAVEQGRIIATWDQRTVDAGNACAWAAYQVLGGQEKLPPEITIVMPRITKENVSEWKAPDELLEAPQEVSIGEEGGRPVLETK